MILVESGSLNSRPLPKDHPYFTLEDSLEGLVGTQYVDNYDPEYWSIRASIFGPLAIVDAVRDLVAGKLSSAWKFIEAGVEPAELKWKLEPFVRHIAPEIMELLLREGVTTVRQLKNWLDEKLSLAYRKQLRWMKQSAETRKPKQASDEDEMEMELTLCRILFPSLDVSASFYKTWLVGIGQDCCDYVMMYRDMEIVMRHRPDIYGDFARANFQRELDQTPNREIDRDLDLDR